MVADALSLEEFIEEFEQLELKVKFYGEFNIQIERELTSGASKILGMKK